MMVGLAFINGMEMAGYLGGVVFLFMNFILNYNKNNPFDETYVVLNLLGISAIFIGLKIK